MQQHNKNIRLINQENAGVSKARNVAFDAAKGKYIYFVDADDVLVEGVINKHLRTMEEYNLDALSVKVIGIEERDYNDSLRKEHNNNSEDIIEVSTGIDFLTKTKLLRNVPIGPYGFIYNRQFLLNHNTYFDTSLTVVEDYIYNLGAIINANRVARSEINTYFYIYRPNSCMHLERTYDEYATLGRNLLLALKKFQKKYLCILKDNNLYNQFIAVIDYYTFTYFFRTMITKCISCKTANDRIKQLKAEGLYPITRHSPLPSPTTREYIVLSFLWHASRCYPLWMLLIGINHAVRGKND